MKSRKILICSIVLLAASYFAFFFHLASPPLYMWDEARNAVHAVEMIERGNFMVKTYDGVSDIHEDSKPPLFLWVVALSMKIFGLNELGLRFPSAMFGLLSAVLLFFFSLKYLGSLQTGAMSWLVLITSLGFLGEHVSRTGDYDAMLTFLMSAYSLLYFLFLESDDTKQQKKYFLFFTVSLVLATMTKGVASLMFLPGLFIYTLVRKKLLMVLKNRIFYLGVFLFIAVVAAYYSVIDLYNPGYLLNVYQRELSSFDKTIDGHQHPFGFYWNNFFTTTAGEGVGSYPHFFPWIFFIPFCSYFILISKNRVARQLGLFCLICTVSYFFIISSSSTKLEWYDAPVYPLASMIVGLGLNEILCIVSDNADAEKKIIYKTALLSVIISIFLLPYLSIFKITYKPKESVWWDQVKYGGLFKNMTRQFPDIKNITVVNPVYNAHLLFYAKAYNRRGYDIKIVKTPDCTFKENDIVAACGWEMREKIKRRYNNEILVDDKFCTACRIKDKKVTQ